MSGCGHRCCEIPSNSYHTHTGRPANCPRCARTGERAPARTGARPGERFTRPDGSESHVLGRIVADVVARVAPQIPGLPCDGELTELVASHALAVYAAGLVDPDVQVLPERDRRTVLAARVGMALAFPGAS